MTLVLKKNADIFTTPEEAKKKLEYYCSYQERCHAEVIKKLNNLGVSQNQIDEIVVYLIQENFLNEERFARSFARGKHRISFWGKNRIVSELKFRNISTYNIKKALEELSDELYFDTFEKVSLSKWENTTDKSNLNKKKKVMDYLLRKGYESDIIYSRLQEFDKK